LCSKKITFINLVDVINLMTRRLISLLMPEGLLKLLDSKCALVYGSRDAAINVAVKRLIQYEILTGHLVPKDKPRSFYNV